MEEKQALDMLGALSQETRLRVVRHLVQRGAQAGLVSPVGVGTGRSDFVGAPVAACHLPRKPGEYREPDFVPAQ